MQLFSPDATYNVFKFLTLKTWKIHLNKWLIIANRPKCSPIVQKTEKEQESFEFLEHSIVISLGHLLWRDLMRPKPWIITVIMVWLATFLIPSNYPRENHLVKFYWFVTGKKTLGHIQLREYYNDLQYRLHHRLSKFDRNLYS